MVVDRLFRPRPDPLKQARAYRAALFFWLRFTDHVLDPKHSLDAASSVFFLGRKAAVPITEAEIIDYYRGGDGKS